MIALIDTCSLIRLCEYYLPFDRDQKLTAFLKVQYQAKNIIIIDAVYEEATFTQKGKILKMLSFLEKRDCMDTSLLQVTRKLSNLVDNQFCNQLNKKKLANNCHTNFAEVYDQQKQLYMSQGDFRLIIAANEIKRKIGDGLFKDQEKVVIVTDESTTENDGKLFRKLPICCKEANVKSLTLASYFKACHVDIDWIIPENK